MDNIKCSTVNEIERFRKRAIEDFESLQVFDESLGTQCSLKPKRVVLSNEDRTDSIVHILWDCYYWSFAVRAMSYDEVCCRVLEDRLGWSTEKIASYVFAKSSELNEVELDEFNRLLEAKKFAKKYLNEDRSDQCEPLLELVEGEVKGKLFYGKGHEVIEAVGKIFNIIYDIDRDMDGSGIGHKALTITTVLRRDWEALRYKLLNNNN